MELAKRVRHQQPPLCFFVCRSSGQIWANLGGNFALANASGGQQNLCRFRRGTIQRHQNNADHTRNHTEIIIDCLRLQRSHCILSKAGRNLRPHLRHIIRKAHLSAYVLLCALVKSAVGVLFFDSLQLVWLDHHIEPFPQHPSFDGMLRFAISCICIFVRGWKFFQDVTLTLLSLCWTSHFSCTI